MAKIVRINADFKDEPVFFLYFVLSEITKKSDV